MANRSEKGGNSDDFIFLGFKITADSDCRQEIKRGLFLGRRIFITLDRILKSRDITLLTKVHLVKAMVFLVVRYGCEIWTIKKDECGRIDTFEQLCWIILLGCKEIQPVHLKGNQSWIFIGRTNAEGEAPILWSPQGKCWLIANDPDAGKIEGKMRREWQKIRWLDGITDSVDMNLSKLLEIVKGREACSSATYGVTKSWRQLRDWTTTTAVLYTKVVTRVNPKSSHAKETFFSISLILYLYEIERLLLWAMNDRRILCPPEERNSIQGYWQGLIVQSFLCNKGLLKYKEIENASDIDIRRGQKECPLGSF